MKSLTENLILFTVHRLWSVGFFFLTGIKPEKYKNIGHFFEQ